MAASHSTDLNLSAKEIGGLASADAFAAFFSKLGYDTSARKQLTPESIGLAGDAAAAIKQIELLSEDSEGFLRVAFVQLRSLTAKSRYDLSRVLGKANVDHLLILTSDFSSIEFVLLDKRCRDHRGPGGVQRIHVVPLTVALARKAAGSKELRTVRRFTWTCRDGLEQFDKLRSVFEAAAFSEDYFCNRALFADHYLLSRLREDSAWTENPTRPFQQVKELLRDARQDLLGKGEDLARRKLFEPVFELLGFKAAVDASAADDPTKPDYLLSDPSGKPLTAAFVYAWDRWLDGPDFNHDQRAPDKNPGAAVVTALEEGVAEWIIVTNGRQWRLYSRQAHSRATNFYEVDLPEALVASGDSDPNEAFRYWWLFFRQQAFQPAAGAEAGCWLDLVAAGSRDYAKTLGERLKERIFLTIFPHLAQGFLEDRKARLGVKGKPSEVELRDTFEATLTLLYRLLFLLYAEARDLLPIREAPYREASLKKVKDEIAAGAGVAESEVGERIKKSFAKDETAIYDRLQKLFAAMDRGNPLLNVPTYNGGLFITIPEKNGGGAKTNERELRIARFLLEHKVPDRFLALAIDHLARDPDDKTFELVPIDYKSLEVRHLGSIYEGLLEFKLKVADEDLTTQADKKAEKYIPLTQAKPRRGRAIEAVVRKGAVYLSNDKAERKASGSYYTPDPIVEYIVEHAVGPVLDEKLEALRGEFRHVRKTFDNEVQKATAFPVRGPSGEALDPRDFAAEKTYSAHKELAERLFEFRTLDPAMGSGHFLVGAVDFITDRLLTFLNQFPINPVTFMLDRTRRNILAALGEQGVTVDPAKLTDVNLLKRHVLKQCIYGVDLNPMAVELAKVSLWLDAFTLGAPLSFLDHHLRCGNSLIGATFNDLQAATQGMLFGIDYEPLLRAIRHVLHVNKMADATAAEVKQSASEYARARDDLSGYQIVLDLLVAKHFGFPKAPGLLEHGDNLDLTSRARFMGSLDDLEELALVERVEDLARQPDRRFFHWEIEFPEVFFGFADANERQLKHKDEISAGSAGFDSVVGNPPYVRGDILDPSTKLYLKCVHPDCYVGTADLYAFFLVRCATTIRCGGQFAMITSDSLLQVPSLGNLRAHLLKASSVQLIIDFGAGRPFADADVRPTIIVWARSPEVEADTQIIELAGAHDKTALAAATCRFHVPRSTLRESAATGWTPRRLQNRGLIDRISAQCAPLSEIVGEPYRGITTGANDVFVVDEETASSLRSDERSGQLIKPFAEGPNIHAFCVSEVSNYLLFTRRGTKRLPKNPRNGNPMNTA